MLIKEIKILSILSSKINYYGIDNPIYNFVYRQNHFCLFVYLCWIEAYIRKK